MYPLLQYHTEYFHCCENPCSTYSCPPPLSSSQASTDLFYCLHSFTFSRISYSWNHTACISYRLLSLGNVYLRFLHVFSWPDSSFLFSADNIPLSGCTTVYLSIHLLKDLGCFQVLAIINKAAINTCVLDISFQLFWVNTKKHDWWIIWWEYV